MIFFYGTGVQVVTVVYECATYNIPPDLYKHGFYDTIPDDFYATFFFL